MEKDSLAAYQAAEGTVFEAVFDDGVLPLELIKVAVKRSSAETELFSLLFRGPKTPFLPQRIYHLRHRAVGEQTLFMVPVGQDESGYLYEIIFNRLTGHAGGKEE
ncbi:DUF6916 family protein [Paenibacillus hamazuiensis]|uniref:DUF6916 family protein n=1 Tax=Paenibacillus hamazuiensis TaxID=2936508 RepID=UPI00200C5DB5|nr:hypothetical protein [Paenibacillus hamazuiensis]